MMKRVKGFEIGSVDGQENEYGRRIVFWGISYNILVSGIVSFLMDISSEMVYAVTPLFLESLGASKQVIGTIEGIAEGTASAFKFLSGFISDKLGRYKPLVTLGYFISAASRPIIATAYGWLQVLGGRITDRFGKGIRTAPRDAILAASAERSALGRSFGLHRAMDQSGAILGPVIASLILGFGAIALSSETPQQQASAFRQVVWVSLIPGFLAAAATLFLVETGRGRKAEEAAITAQAEEPREGEPPGPPEETDESAEHADWTRRYWYFLATMFVFSIGNSSNAFLLLRAQNLGLAAALVPLAYATMNAVYTAASVPWGVWADRIGFKLVILVGFFIYALVYTGFATANATWMVWFLFGAYGLFESAFEGQSRAYLARIAKAHLRGTSFGFYHMLLALTILPASFIGGYLWDHVGPPATFYYGASTAALAFVMLLSEPLILGRE